MVDPIFLRCLSGPKKGELLEFYSAYRYVFGREPKSEDDGSFFVELASKNISRQHAEIFFEEGSWRILDLKSFNGIRVDRMKVKEAYLQDKNIIEMAEFVFRVEFSNEEIEAPQSENFQEESAAAQGPEQTSPKVKSEPEESRGPLASFKSFFEKVDFRFKLLFIFLALGAASFYILKFPILLQVEKDLLQQSYRQAMQKTKTLGDRNREVLFLSEPFRLECSIFRDDREVISAVLWDRFGKQLCREGRMKTADELLGWAMEDQEFYSTCDFQKGIKNLEACSSAYPVKKWIDEEGKMMTVGFAQVDFFPKDVIQQLDHLDAQLYKVLFVLIAFFVAAWGVVYFWLKTGVKDLEEDVHLLFTGATQKVDSPESFAVFGNLAQEVNRLFVKLNQGLSPTARGGSGEAGFLQDILQQILMLEERAVLAIDHENQILAYSPFAPEVIPLSESAIDLHVSEGIADTYLQGELMRFLNDLSQSHEVMDRALAMSDRIVQAQGLPLYVRGEHKASLILF